MTGGTTNQATLKISGWPAPGTWSGALRVSGDALLQFGSGGLTAIATGASLELDGAQARILTSGGSASGLGGLANNYGTLTLRGGNNIGSGAGGAAISTTTAFTNHATFNVDASYGDGGSTASFGGVFANYGTTTIGNYALTASTTVSATGLASNGVLTIQGNTTGGTSNQAAVKSAAPRRERGRARCASPATRCFSSAAACSPESRPVPSLELDGAQARILTSGGSVSGLGGLANNYGTLTLRGGNNIGCGRGRRGDLDDDGVHQPRDVQRRRLRRRRRQHGEFRRRLHQLWHGDDRQLRADRFDDGVGDGIGQ